MSDHQFSNSSLWEQYYYQDHSELVLDESFLATPCPEFSDATIVSTTTQVDADDHEILFSPKDSVVAGSAFSSESTENPSSSDLKPKGDNPGTPKRRRSRASKLTPTTFLNAHITNFRSLVQKHTGCHKERGPITLCFGSASTSSSTTTNYGQPINELISANNSPEAVSGRNRYGICQQADQSYNQVQNDHEHHYHNQYQYQNQHYF